MPLEHSSSPGALKRNMGVLFGEIGKSPHVQSRAQAIAIALNTQRRARGRDGGGSVNTDAVQSVINALQQGAGGSSSPVGISSPTPNSTAAASNTSAPAAAPTVATPSLTAPAATPMTSPTGLAPAGSAAAVQQPQPSSAPAVGTSVGPVLSGTTMPIYSPADPNAGAMGVGSLPGFGTAAPTAPLGGAPAQTGSALATGGVANRAGGGFNMAKGPHLDAPWQTRSEARQMHVGPVLSAVPGRTDNHPVKVPSSSYVFPASFVSSLGKGNTLAGMDIVNRMYQMGPYGSTPMKMGHGNTMPKPPRPGKMFASGGHVGTPVDVNISGGEVVVPPEKIIEKHGSIKNGHKIMDAFVMAQRAKAIQEEKRLPPPAKD